VVTDIGGNVAGEWEGNGNRSSKISCHWLLRNSYSGAALYTPTTSYSLRIRTSGQWHLQQAEISLSVHMQLTSPL
jgi:predicted SprT family Zn-dependent metalloprotease